MRRRLRKMDGADGGVLEDGEARASAAGGDNTKTPFDSTETAYDSTETAYDSTETAYDGTEAAYDSTETAYDRHGIRVDDPQEAAGRSG
jgi:hypothetical protein